MSNDKKKKKRNVAKKASQLTPREAAIVAMKEFKHGIAYLKDR